MKVIKMYIWTLVMLGLVGCARNEKSEASSSADLEFLILTIDNKEILIEFDNREATIMLNQNLDLEGTVKFQISDGAILLHNRFILVQGADIKIKEGEETFFVVMAEDESEEVYKVKIYTPSFFTKQLEWVSLGGQEASIEDSLIRVNLPYGTDLSNLKLDFKHNGARASMKTGGVEDFTQRRQIVVQAKDGTEQRYNFSLRVNQLEQIHILGIKIERTGQIIKTEREDDTFRIDLPEDVDPYMEKITVDVDIPTGYISTLNSGDNLKYEKGKLIPFAVKVSEQFFLEYFIDLRDTGLYDRLFVKDKIFKAFKMVINKADYTVDIEGDQIQVNIPQALDIETVVPLFTLGQGYQASIKSGKLLTDIRANLGMPLKITAENETLEKVYTLTIKRPKRDEAFFEELFRVDRVFESFELSVNENMYSVKKQDNQLSTKIPYAEVLQKVVPLFTLSKGFTASIQSGQELADVVSGEPKLIEVTAKSGDKREFFLTVFKGEITIRDILNQVKLTFTSFDMSINSTDYDVELTGNDIYVDVSKEVELDEVIPRFTLAEGLSASITSGEKLTDIQANTPKLVRVEAESGEAQDYFLTIRRDKSTIKRLISLDILSSSGQIYAPHAVERQEGSQHIQKISIDFPFDINFEVDEFSLDFELEDKRAKLFFDGQELISKQSQVALATRVNQLTVQAEDGSEQIVILEVNAEGYFDRTLKIEKLFTSFDMTINKADYPVELTSNTINITVPIEVTLDEVIPLFTLAKGVTASIISGEKLDNIQANTPKTIEVKTDNGGSKEFFMTISREVSQVKRLISMDLISSAGERYTTTIEQQNVLIVDEVQKLSIFLPAGVDLDTENFTLDFELDGHRAKLYHTGQQLEPKLTEVQFVKGINKFKIQAENQTEREVILEINGEGYSDFIFKQNPVFTSFLVSINEKEYDVTFDGNNINLTLPSDVSMDRVVPRFTLAPGLTASIVSDQLLTDIQANTPKAFTVQTAKGDEMREYFLNIKQLSSSKDLLKFSLMQVGGETKEVQDMRTLPNGHIQSLSYFFDSSDVRFIEYSIEFELSDAKAKIFLEGKELKSGENYGYLTEGLLNLTIVAEDKTEQITQLKVDFNTGVFLNDILSFDAYDRFDVPLDVTLLDEAVEIRVPVGTDLRLTRVKYTVSSSATKSVKDGTVDFVVGEPMDFVVTSSAGTEKTYKVTVIETDEFLIKATRKSGRLLNYVINRVTQFTLPSGVDRTERPITYSFTYGDNYFVKSITRSDRYSDSFGYVMWTFYYDIFNRVYKIKADDTNISADISFIIEYDTDNRPNKIFKIKDLGRRSIILEEVDVTYMSSGSNLEVSRLNSKEISFTSIANAVVNYEGKKVSKITYLKKDRKTPESEVYFSNYDNGLSPFFNLFPSNFVYIFEYATIGVEDVYVNLDSSDFGGGFKTENNSLTERRVINGVEKVIEFTEPEYNIHGYLSEKKYVGNGSETIMDFTTYTYTYEF